MARSKPPKKSESLEIRIPYPTKTAFMALCQARGRSASEDLRGFIEQQLAAPAAPRAGFRLRQIAVGALTGIGTARSAWKNTGGSSRQVDAGFGLRIRIRPSWAQDATRAPSDAR